MQHDEELAIAHGLREGSPHAWQAFYDAYCDRLWNTVARRIGWHSSDVADVVQETFMAAARSARSYEPSRGSLWMWLLGIARHHIALYFRRNRQLLHSIVATSQPLPKQLRDLVSRGEISGEDVVASAELAMLVRLALAELPPDYEELLTAKYLDEISLVQLAETDGSSQEAIRSKLARARREFRRAFQRVADGSPDVKPRPDHES